MLVIPAMYSTSGAKRRENTPPEPRMLWVLSACADPAAALAACAELAGPPDPVASPLPKIGEGIEMKARIEGAMQLVVTAMSKHADTIFLSLKLPQDLN